MSLVGAALRMVRSPAAVYLVSTAVCRSAAIFLIPLYTRVLSLSEYGEYALAQTAATILAAIVPLGMNSSVSRFYFDGEQREDGAAKSGAVARWMTILTLAHLVFWAGLVLLFAPEGTGLWSRRAALLLLLTTGGAAISPVLMVYFRAVQRPYVVALLQLLEFALTTGAGLLFVLVLDRGFYGALEAQAAATGLMGCLAATFIWTRMPGRLDAVLLKRGARFSAPFLAQVIASWLVSAADRWALKAAGLDQEVGSYALATQLTSAAAMPTAAFAEAELARTGEVYRAIGMEGVASESARSRRLFLLASGLPAGALLLAMPIIELFIGGDASATTSLIPVLCLVLILDAQFYPSQLVIYCSGHSRYMLIVTTATVVTSMSALLLFVPLYGVAGALAARALGSAARLIASWAMASRALKVAA